MTKSMIPWIYNDTFSPYYSFEENELTDEVGDKEVLNSEPLISYPNNQEILY